MRPAIDVARGASAMRDVWRPSHAPSYAVCMDLPFAVPRQPSSRLISLPEVRYAPAGRAVAPRCSMPCFTFHVVNIAISVAQITT